MGLGVLGHPVGVQEGPGEIHQGLAAPDHFQPGFGVHLGHQRGFQVFGLGDFNKAVLVFRTDDAGHALLGFGDGQLGTVQTLVLAGHRVQIDGQARGQLADGHAYPARAEVVAPLDHAREFLVAEQPLNVPLGGRVALLNLRAAGGEGLFGMGLGGTGGPAAAVASGASAQEDHQIAGLRGFAHHVFAGHGRDHRAGLQPLGHKARVVNLLHLARGQADLVAVG